MSMIQQVAQNGISSSELFEHYLQANVQIGLADIFEIKCLASQQNVETLFIEAHVGLRDKFNYRNMIGDLTKSLDWCDVRTHVTKSKSDVHCYIYVTDKLKAKNNTISIILVTVSSDKTKATVVSVEDYSNSIETVLLKHVHDDQHPAFTLNLTNEGIMSTRRSIRKSTANIARQEYYPYMNIPLNEYFDMYLNSSSPILFMIGLAGTGKTTFGRSLVLHSGKSVCSVYDEATMRSPDLMNYFYSSEHQILFIEDADDFLVRRSEGNKDLASLLNFADGLVSDPGKKIVISTNLSSVNKVDEALLRRGRCFDILKFQALTPEQAVIARQVAGLKPLEFTSDVILADVLDKNSQQLTNTRTRQVGFQKN